MNTFATHTAGQHRFRTGLWLLGLFALLGVVAWALCAGDYPLTVHQALNALLHKGDPTAIAVVNDLRLPRLLGALLVGAALAGAGAAYQMLFRNPLVSPDILGVSTGAGLGAVLGIFLNLPQAGVQGFAFAGGLLTVAGVVLCARGVKRGDPLLSLVLIGLVMASLTGAVTALLKVLADPYNQLPAMTFWLLGSLANANMNQLLWILPAVVLGVIGLTLRRWGLNALAWGEDEARALGLPVARIRLEVIVYSTLISSAVVSAVGVVGWVGLIIPHAARLLVGPNFPRLFPVSLLLGALFLALVDTASRAFTAFEVPLGVITALLGGPVFLALLMRRGGVSA
ncbi:MAG TPA: iron ABC transporter permease [Limnobacter sp.]|uniref:FecCD family ABC transporter permease n=1 Tax=Limnobacter sp. TaxID=2003368 RepID=UPI002EDB2E7E